MLLLRVGADDNPHDYIPSSGYSEVLPDDDTSHGPRDAFRFIY